MLKKRQLKARQIPTKKHKTTTRTCGVKTLNLAFGGEEKKGEEVSINNSGSKV